MACIGAGNNDWLINYMKIKFVSRLNPQLLRSTKSKMASQSAPSSAAMEVESGEEVKIKNINEMTCLACTLCNVITIILTGISAYLSGSWEENGI